MVSTSAIDLCQYPQELIAFATNEAGRDAIDLGDFLTAAGLAPPPGETRGIPKGILLDLGAVVRLRRSPLSRALAISRGQSDGTNAVADTRESSTASA